MTTTSRAAATTTTATATPTPSPCRLSLGRRDFQSRDEVHTAAIKLYFSYKKGFGFFFKKIKKTLPPCSCNSHQEHESFPVGMVVSPWRQDGRAAEKMGRIGHASRSIPLPPTACVRGRKIKQLSIHAAVTQLSLPPKVCNYSSSSSSM